MSEISRRGFLGGIVASIAGTELVVRTQSVPTGLRIEQPVHIIQPGDPQWIYSGYHWDWPVKVGELVFRRQPDHPTGMIPVGTVMDLKWRAYSNPAIADTYYLGQSKAPQHSSKEPNNLPVATIALFGMTEIR